jgi:hypothetical protein
MRKRLKTTSTLLLRRKAPGLEDLVRKLCIEEASLRCNCDLLGVLAAGPSVAYKNMVTISVSRHQGACIGAGCSLQLLLDLI